MPADPEGVELDPLCRQQLADTRLHGSELIQRHCSLRGRRLIGDSD
jgi:hypothetical protein